MQCPSPPKPASQTAPTRSTKRGESTQDVDDFALMSHVVMLVKTLIEYLAALREEIRYIRSQGPPLQHPIADRPMHGNAQISERVVMTHTKNKQSHRTEKLPTSEGPALNTRVAKSATATATTGPRLLDERQKEMLSQAKQQLQAKSLRQNLR